MYYWILSLGTFAIIAGLSYGAYRLVSVESLAKLVTIVLKATLPFVFKPKTDAEYKIENKDYRSNTKRDKWGKEKWGK